MCVAVLQDAEEGFFLLVLAFSRMFLTVYTVFFANTLDWAMGVARAGGGVIEIPSFREDSEFFRRELATIFTHHCLWYAVQCEVCGYFLDDSDRGGGS